MTNIMEAHGIPKVNLVAAGVGVCRTIRARVVGVPQPSVFARGGSQGGNDARRRASAVSDDPRNVKRTLPWQAQVGAR